MIKVEDKKYLKSMESNIKKYYVYSYFDMFWVFLPFIIYYFQNLGFSLTQIALIQGAYLLTVFLFEIPTGYITDRIGRKNSLILSTILVLCNMAVLYFFTNFYVLLLNNILLGLGVTFFSGSISALIYDSLLEVKKENDYKEIEGKGHFFGEGGVITASIIGSLLITYGIHITILLTFIAYIIQLMITFSLKEPKVHKEKEKYKGFIEENKAMFEIAFRALRNKKLLGIFLYSFFVMGISNTIFAFYQPYFRDIGIDVFWYGFIFAVLSIPTAIASYYVHRIEKKLGVFRTLMVMPLLLVFTLIGMSAVYVWIGIIFIFGREIVRGLSLPVLNDYSNKMIASKERATVLSVGNMFARIGLMIISLMFGFFADMLSIRILLFSLGVFSIIISIVVYFVMKNGNNKKG